MHLCVSGAFENGLAEHDIEEALQPISAVRLVVQSDADVWALLSEVWPESFCVFMCVFLCVSVGVLTHTHRSIKQQHSEKSKILIQKFLNINKNFTWNLSFFFLSHLQNSFDWHPWLCCCCDIDWDNFHFRDYHWLHSMWLWQWAAWCTGASSWTPALHGVQVVNEDRWHGIYIRW